MTNEALGRAVEEFCGVEAEDFGGVEAEVDDVGRVGYGRGCRARGTDGEPEDVDVRALSGAGGRLAERREVDRAGPGVVGIVRDEGGVVRAWDRSPPKPPLANATKCNRRPVVTAGRGKEVGGGHDNQRPMTASC